MSLIIENGVLVKSFPHELSTEEKSNYAIEASRLFEKIEKEKQNAKALAAQQKDKITELETQYKILNSKVITGVEQRSFECKVVLDFSAGVKRFIDKLTNTEKGSQPLESEDYQLKLDTEAEQVKKQIVTGEELENFNDPFKSDDVSL